MPRRPAAVQGDAARLRQVVVNLAGNSIKFTESGEIEVKVQVQERNVEGVTPAVQRPGYGDWNFH